MFDVRKSHTTRGMYEALRVLFSTRSTSLLVHREPGGSLRFGSESGVNVILCCLSSLLINCNASRDAAVPVLGWLARSPGPLLHSQACASSGSGCRICASCLRAAAEGTAGAMARRCRACRSWGRGAPPARSGRHGRSPRGPRGFHSFSSDSCPGAGCGGYAAGCAADWPWAPQWKEPI